MPTGFEKIVALVRRTGDRCVVVDRMGNPEFVVVPFAEYERNSAREASAAGTDSLVSAITEHASRRPSGPAKSWEANAPEEVPPSVLPGADAADQYFFEPIE